MKRNSIKTRSTLLLVFVFGQILISSCTKIPNEGSIAPDVSYKDRKQYAISGLKQDIGTFKFSTSSLPLNFEIVSISESSNKDMSALTQKVHVVQYKEPIVGNETPSELLLKTDTVLVSAVSINQHTGQLEVLEGNNIPAGEYHFDIKVTNQSGSKILKDALVVEFKEFEVKTWSSGMKKQPEIERVADSPNQIRFVGYLNNTPLTGDQIDFTKSRVTGFKGTFVDDTNQGEIWNVKFPVKESDTFCSWKIVKTVNGAEEISYANENFNFVLGRPGSYIIKLYK
jgi:hypothetical protein